MMMNVSAARTSCTIDPTKDLFAHTLKENHTGFDTCTFLLEPLERQRWFFDNLRRAQELSGAVVWTTEETLSEIASKINSPNPALAQSARIAQEETQRMLAENRLIVYRASSESPQRRRFADAAFLSRLIENTANVPIALVTLDGDLAMDAMELNEMHSVRGKRIYIYRVNGAGTLSRFTFIRNAEGKYVNPKNSPLFNTGNLPPATADSTPRPMPEANEGDTLWSASGRTYTLGDEINNGGEAGIFDLQGCPELVAKIFTAHSERKEAKCKLLARAAKDFPCPGAVMPQEILYDAQGTFRGYTMRKIKGVELTRLMTTRGQQQHASSWNRQNYVRLASCIADIIRDFSLAGLLIGDVAPGNIILSYNESGVLEPNRNLIHFIDVDSAQFGCPETGIFPPDGLTPEYAPPEFLRMGVSPDTLRTAKNQVFSVAMLCMQLCMCGVHPFRKSIQEEGQALSIPESIAACAFPYSAGTELRQAISPNGAEKLFSNTPADFKKFHYGLFQQGGAMNAVEKRPSFFALSKVLNNYVSWLDKPETLQRYPEATSLAPQALKPFYTRCAHHHCATPEQEFAVTSFRSDGRYFCPACLARVRAQRAAAEAPILPQVPALVPQQTPAPVAQQAPVLAPQQATSPVRRTEAPQQPAPAPRAPFRTEPVTQRPAPTPTAQNNPIVRKLAHWLGF